MKKHCGQDFLKTGGKEIIIFLSYLAYTSPFWPRTNKKNELSWAAKEI